MKELTNKEMESVGGGFLLTMFVINSLRSFNIGSSLQKIFGNQNQEPAPTPAEVNSKSDAFRQNMKDMFGASAGRDLAKIAESAGLVGVVNSIFGW